MNHLQHSPSSSLEKRKLVPSLPIGLIGQEQEKTERTMFHKDNRHYDPFYSLSTRRQLDIVGAKTVNPYDQGIRKVLQQNGKKILFQLYRQISKLSRGDEDHIVLGTIDEIISKYIEQEYRFTQILKSLQNIHQNMNQIQKQKNDQSPISFPSTVTPIKKYSHSKLQELLSSIKEKKGSSIQSVKQMREYEDKKRENQKYLQCLYQSFKKVIKFSVNSLALTFKLNKNKSKVSELIKFGEWYNSFSIQVSGGLQIKDVVAFVSECTNRITKLQYFMNTLLISHKLF